LRPHIRQPGADLIAHQSLLERAARALLSLWKQVGRTTPGAGPRRSREENACTITTNVFSIRCGLKPRPAVCTTTAAGHRRHRGRDPGLHAVFLSGLGLARVEQQVPRHAAVHRHRGNWPYRDAAHSRRPELGASAGNTARNRRRGVAAGQCHHGRRASASCRRRMLQRHILSTGMAAFPANSDGVPFDMSHVYASGNLVGDMYCNVAAEATGRFLAVRLFN
jgi:hypothetical protein